MQSAVTFIYKQSKIGSTLSLCRPGGVRTVSQNNTKRFFLYSLSFCQFLKARIDNSNSAHYRGNRCVKIATLDGF